jgi:CRP/FNR family transcriptional regulator, dissimilatory nitrate respiration regulator
MNKLSMPPSHLRDTMSRLAYFYGWESGLLSRLALGASQRWVGKDQPLLSRGEIADHLFIVVSGQVRLALPLSNGMERIVALVMPGEGFGEASMLLNVGLPYRAVACRDSHLLAIHAPTFLGEMHRAPKMLEHTLRLVARQYQSTLQDMDICAQPSSLQRVLRFLISQQPEEAAGEGFQITLPSRKRDIAAKLGLSQETFSRMLSFLCQENLIAMQGSSIRVEDGMQLRHLEASIGNKVAHTP